MCGATARVGPREGGAGRGAEGAEDVALAAPAVVDLLPGPACRWWLRRTHPARLSITHILEAGGWPEASKSLDPAESAVIRCRAPRRWAEGVRWRRACGTPR